MSTSPLVLDIQLFSQSSTSAGNRVAGKAESSFTAEVNMGLDNTPLQRAIGAGVINK